MNTQSIVDQLQNKVEECLQGVQEQLDSSFNRIEAFLDQLPFASYTPVVHNSVNFKPSIVQQSLPSIEIFTNQLIQEIKPIINLKIHQQIKQTQHQQQQLIKSQTKQIQQQNKQQDIITNNDYQLNINQQQFTYNLLQNNSIQQNDYCFAIAINKDNSILLAGCEQDIKVFEFKQEQLKQTQILSEHSNNVITLNFMKKQNQFISSDSDGYIIIWQMNENNQWICQQKLKEHSKCINCLIINNNEDVIISGSDDYTIKFWQKQQQWVYQQTITDHKSNVCGLSMNDQQNRVISCAKDNLILIIEQSSLNQKWNIIQKISVEVYGYRLCFINDNVFTFQPDSKDQMHVYEMNSNNKEYSKTKEIAVKTNGNCYYHFPQQYIKQKCLVVSKNGYIVNLIRKNPNGEFITKQSIDFGSNYIYGQMSEDGEYLMTWDSKSNNIQIRKYDQK